MVLVTGEVRVQVKECDAQKIALSLQQDYNTSFSSGDFNAALKICLSRN